MPWHRMLAFMDDLNQIEFGTNIPAGTLVTDKKTPRLRAYGAGATTEYPVSRGLASQALYLPERLPQRLPPESGAPQRAAAMRAGSSVYQSGLWQSGSGPGSSTGCAEDRTVPATVKS